MRRIDDSVRAEGVGDWREANANDDGVHVLPEDDLPPSRRGEGRTFHGMFIPTCILDSVVTSAWRLYSEGSMVNMIPYFGPEKMRPGNEGKGFLKKDSLRHMPKTSATPTSAYLCVFQKLLASKATEAHAFALLCGVLECVPLDAFTQYLPTVFQLALTRMQTNNAARRVARPRSRAACRG